MRTILILLYLPVLAVCAPASPKVAVLYSAWSGSTFRDEYDGCLQALGWPYEKFENREVGRLVERLGDFDLVVATSVANYENPVDMAPYADQWRAFLERGGGLLITDASYGSVLDLWTNRLGPDWALTSSGCAPYTGAHGGSAQITCDPGHPYLLAPNPLEPLLRAKGGIWAHIDSWGSGWHSLVSCADGKSLLVLRDVGRGCAVVTSYFSMRGPTGKAAASGLLENLWLRVQGLRSGLALTAVDLGQPVLGKQCITVGLRNVGEGERTVKVEGSLAWGDGEPRSVGQLTLTIPPTAEVTLRLPYVVDQRGDLHVRVGITPEGAPELLLTRNLTLPPMVTLRLPNRHLYPWHTELPWVAAFVPDAGVDLADCASELLVDGKVVARQQPAPQTGEFTTDASQIPEGRHTATLRLVRGDVVLGTADVEFRRHPRPRVYLRADGTTMVDGKPFFPFGWYHVSWPFTAEERLACLRDIAAGGFNTIHASLKQMDEWEPFLQEAERLGVKVITEFGVDAFAAVERYRGHNAVLAWNPGDEPDGGGVPPEEMLARHERFKDIDPDHPSYMVLCVPSSYARYVASADIIAPDIYPIRHGGGNPAHVYQFMTQCRMEAARHGRPIYGVLQCFGYDDPASWRVPTFEECRVMTYLALLAGVKGVIYYTYADSGFQMSTHPGLWAQMQTLPGEIRALEPFLLDGELQPLSTGAEGVFAGAWTLGQRMLVVITNATADRRDVTVSLPGGQSGRARELLGGDPGGLQAEEGALRGQMEPLQVQVFEAGP